MELRADRFRQCAVICAAIDYDSPASVQRNNDAVDEMRRIVADAGDAIVELLPLLDEPLAGPWLAFQALELCTLDRRDRERCLAIIRRIAAGSDLNALGARMWMSAYQG